MGSPRRRRPKPRAPRRESPEGRHDAAKPAPGWPPGTTAPALRRRCLRSLRAAPPRHHKQRAGPDSRQTLSSMTPGPALFLGVPPFGRWATAPPLDLRPTSLVPRIYPKCGAEGPRARHRPNWPALTCRARRNFSPTTPGSPGAPQGGTARRRRGG